MIRAKNKLYFDSHLWNKQKNKSATQGDLLQTAGGGGVGSGGEGAAIVLITVSMLFTIFVLPPKSLASTRRRCAVFMRLKFIFHKHNINL